MEKMDTPISYMDADEFQKFWDADAKRLIKAYGRSGKSSKNSQPQRAHECHTAGNNDAYKEGRFPIAPAWSSTPERATKIFVISLAVKGLGSKGMDKGGSICSGSGLSESA